MSFSRQSLEILLDLIEIKVGALQIQDRDDARELNRLKKCRQELINSLNQARPRRGNRLITPLSEKRFNLRDSQKHTAND